MAQNCLYMFEFVVDDILITRPNHCAPAEYPTCCEISFRSSVFVSICDREFGQCVESSAQCGKCCLFSLESPVTSKDRLLIHVYKKKTEKCKFLLGATELPIKPLFDKVYESFNARNENWIENSTKHTAKMPDPKTPPSKTMVVDNDCDEEAVERPEQLCATSEVSKRLLPLFNMKGKQTGNLVLIMRLVCNGPTIVSSFPFGQADNNAASKKQPCPADNPTSEHRGAGGGCSVPDPCRKKEHKPTPCHRYFASNAEKGCPCDDCEDDYDEETASECKQNTKKQKCSSCQQPDACQTKEPKASMCQRYFNNSDNGGCPCEEWLDECEAEECSEEEEPEPMKPCFIQASAPDPGPEAYEEFEACLNGSGVVIRVLRDTHQVESIDDGEELDDKCSDCEKCQKDNCSHFGQNMQEFVGHGNYAQNYLDRRTNGPIINNPNLPKIRANMKYSGNDVCCPEELKMPLTKMKQFCNNQEKKLAMYRHCKPNEQYDTSVPLQHAGNIRNCCLQVDQNNITSALQGINTDARKKGIEVCYRTCENSDSDVFLVKLGSKHPSKNKKNCIEIELKTPKQPMSSAKQKVTTETQITEAELDNEMANRCKKGRKGKKGKGKGKGKK